ncbi:uncharacterized protein [Lolium perenne]|uniref:uncharacterized protein n=1 Tax=Lolium perenne TaxID=4522 RepID=UPI003A98D5D6
MWRQSMEAQDREYFMHRIEEMEEDLEYGTFTKEMPAPMIVKYHDLLEKLWGWDKLLPKGDSVSWSDYSAYLNEYHSRNFDAVGSSIADLAQTCLNSEDELVSEWKIQMKSETLPIRKSIVLSCLIDQRVRSFIRKGCSSSHVSGAALLCIAKEADLTCQLLRRGADPVDDYLVNQGREIRMCALSLMNCTSDSSVAASGALLEAQMMCAWMSQNNKPLDFEDDPIPDEIIDSRIVRYRTFNVMINLLEESSAAAAGYKFDKGEPSSSRNGDGGDGDGVTAADGAANATVGGISDVLNSHYKKNTEGGEKTKKMRMEKEDLFEKLWGWERLLPLWVLLSGQTIAAILRSITTAMLLILLMVLLPTKILRIRKSPIMLTWVLLLPNLV